MVSPATLKLLRWFGHQHWIVKGRDRMIRMIADPDTIAPTPFDVNFFGLRYRGNLQSFIDWHIFFYGSWARNELLLLQKLVSAARTRGATSIQAFDVGANVGNHSLFLSTICDHVYSFEPYGPVRKELEDKIAYNGRANITVLPIALGERDEELDYSIAPGVNSGEGSFVGRGETTTKLPVRNGDAYFANNQLPKIDLIKIDVEGFEGFVLRGLREHVHKDRPIIMCELSNSARAHIGSDREFYALIPSGYIFAEVGTKSISGPYRLREFVYGKSREFVAVPQEMLATATRLVPELLKFLRTGAAL